MRRALSAFGAVAASMALAATGAHAKAGDPDPGFGAGGRTVVDVVVHSNAFATSIAIDHQGRVVVAGFFARPLLLHPVLARLTPDGSLDPGFGNGGIVLPQWGGPASIGGVAVDAAGRVVLAGSVSTSTGEDFAVARLLGDGEPDPSFSGDGLTTLDGGDMTSDHGTDMALDGQGRILLSGSSMAPAFPEEQRFTAVRVTAAGLPDASFGEDGIVVVDFGGSGAAEAIAIDPQGRVVLAGTATLGEDQDFAVARLDSTGLPDPGLDGDGRARLGFGSGPVDGEVATDVAVDANGRLLLVGRTGPVFHSSALAARLLPGGAPDPSFDGDGRLALGLSDPAAAEALAIDRDGRIVVAGLRREGEEATGQTEAEEAFLARLQPDGALDSSFGAAGVVRESFGTTGFAGAAAVTVDSAGRYLIAGHAWGARPKGFALARYLGEDQVAACRGRRATIVGTRGPDTLRGTRGRDVIAAFAGNDRVRALGGRDLVCAGRGRDLVRAGAGNDLVFGASGDDKLFGQAGKDRLRGGRGSDRLAGGSGRDSLQGGPGNDVEH